VNPAYDDLMGEILAFLKDAADRAVNAGINPGRIIADPGIGFGKTMDHNLQIINESDRFLELGVPVMIGPSRKAFIRKLLSPFFQTEIEPDSPETEAGTQAAVAAAAIKGVHIIRVHNVADTRTTLLMADALRNQGAALHGNTRGE
ncbi:MAG: dihydropteroate synthase, partial [Desulfosalsimonas sp.]